MGKKGCEPGANKYLCPCFDTTNGFVTMGKCVATNKCEATGTSDGKLDQGMSKLGEMLGKLMEALKGKDGGGGGGSPTDPNTGMCTTMQPTGDRAMAEGNPMCYFYNPASDPTSKENQTDPSGGLVANPTEGETPLKVTFAYTNGTTGCNTPELELDYADGAKYNVPVHAEDGCRSIQETVDHTYSAAGTFAARLKIASTGDIRGGVNLTIAAGTNPTPNNGQDCVGGTTGTGGSASACGNGGTGGTNGGSSTNVTGVTTGTGGTNSNTSAPLFTTPLTNLNNSGSVSGGSVSTGGSASLGNGSTGISASTGGTNDAGASLNFNSPQSIVQSIVAKNLPPGAYGDVKILSNGTTIIAGVREGKTEVAGFFGTNSTSGTSAVAKMCTNRPWSKNFLSYIIPPSFFDSLCTWRGYAVGPSTAPVVTTKTTTPATQPVVTKTTVGGTKTTPAKATTTTAQPLNAKVDIWASPTTVPLGARTSIFWNTQGVTDCIETSPDGSFTQTTLKGGASTVPLTQSTTFTISCIAPNGAHITDSVVVQIAL